MSTPGYPQRGSRRSSGQHSRVRPSRVRPSRVRPASATATATNPLPSSGSIREEEVGYSLNPVPANGDPTVSRIINVHPRRCIMDHEPKGHFNRDEIAEWSFYIGSWAPESSEDVLVPNEKCLAFMSWAKDAILVSMKRQLYHYHGRFDVSPRSVCTLALPSLLAEFGKREDRCFGIFGSQHATVFLEWFEGMTSSSILKAEPQALLCVGDIVVDFCSWMGSADEVALGTKLLDEVTSDMIMHAQQSISRDFDS